MTRDHAAASRPVASTPVVSQESIRLEPRCRVCRNDELRQKVNDSLSSGASYAMIVRTLEADNAALDPRDRVAIDSVRNHSARHFPVQSVAQATYREILERRAAENAVDFVDGVANALSPIAFFETVMVKAYKNLVDDDTVVDLASGMNAAVRLQAVLESYDPKPDMARLHAQVQQIGHAVQDVVPKSMWTEILSRLDKSPLPEPTATEDLDIPFDPDEDYDDLNDAW